MRQRLKLLGRRLGVELDLDELDRSQAEDRMTKYEAYLQRHYNLSRQDAAKAMDDALQAETQRRNSPTRRWR
jgi:hypothetical protein